MGITLTSATSEAKAFPTSSHDLDKLYHISPHRPSGSIASHDLMRGTSCETKGEETWTKQNLTNSDELYHNTRYNTSYKYYLL